MVVRRPKMIQTFLQEVREKSEKAARKNVSLLLFVFCHGTEDRVLLLGQSQQKGLRPSELNEAVHPRCRATMLNTACFSGGWIVSKPGGISLNVTAMTAASEDEESHSWVESPSIGRHCGSPWASAVIDTLLSTSSPFLAHPTSSQDSTLIEPETEQQMETYNSFCRTVLKTTTERVTLWSCRESFTFSAQDDKWNWPWGQRTGFPIEQRRLKARWDALETYAPQIPQNDPDDPFPEWHQLDPDPRNPKRGEIVGSSRTGGLSPMDQFALAEAQQEAITMAKAFLETCPNSWNEGWGINIKGDLNRLIRGEKPTKVNPVAMMKFFWEAAQHADNLVAYFGLPIPDERPCLMWDRFQSLQERESQIPNYHEKHLSAFRRIVDSGISPQPIEDVQGYPFNRYTPYIATAVALANLSSEKQDELLTNMIDFVLKERKAWVEPAVQVAGKKRGIRERGRDYIKQVNKRIALRSLSPRKRESTSSTPRRGRSDSHASSVNPEELIESTLTRSPAPLRRSNDESRRSFDIRRSFDRPSG
jgi:hypothetical protein